MNEQTEALLKELDEIHREIILGIRKPKDTVYSRAAAEIRRLLAERPA